MENVSNYKYNVRAKIIDKSLPSYGKEVNVIKKVNRWKYLIEYTPGGKTYYIDVDSLQII